MNGKLFVLLFTLSLTLLISVSECSSQEAVNIFGNLVPSNSDNITIPPRTVGVKFWSTQSGSISAIRFYRGKTSPLGYVASLYSASGTLLGSVTMEHESGAVPGWQIATFAAPISISPNTTYVGAYYIPSGTYQRVPYGLTQGVTTGPLTAPASSIVGGNGIYRDGKTFPTTKWQDANFFVDVVFTPTAAAPDLIPAQAAAVGFSTLAFNGDMTESFDVSCYNPATGPYQWYLGANRLMWANCNNLKYPHIDETDGSTVLDIQLGPNTNDGGQQGRVGISTSDAFGAYNHNFPINAYYECVVRMDPESVGHLPLWHNCWMSDVHTINDASLNTIEYDMTEFHGGYLNAVEIAGTINWACRDTCYGTAWFGDLSTKIPGYDPSKFHKYGMLTYQTSPTNLHVVGYVDNVKITEGDTQLSGPSEQAQRNYIVIDLTGACNWDEGSFYCTNQPVQNVYADASGNTHIQTPNAVMSTAFKLGINGVTGVTSPINGNFHFWQDNWHGGNPDFGCTGPCTLTLYDDNWNPIPFNGTYSGGGVVNKWEGEGMHVYVKSFRVWSCSTWKNRQCSVFNPN